MLRRNLSLTFLIVAALATSALAQLPTATLSTVYPPGGKAGATVDITVGGANLDDGERLVFSHPGLVGVPKMAAVDDFHPTPAKMPDQFTVTIAADVPSGVYEVRHLGRYGASNPRSFAVGTLNEVVDAGNNQKKETPQEIAEQSTITGRMDANNIDF